MKKIVSLLLVIFMCLSLVACNSESNTTITDPSANQSNESTQNSGGNKNEQNKYADISVKVTGKTSLPVDYDENRYSQRVEFSFDISNKTSKSIKGIKGVLTIKDLFGSKIISLNCDFTGKTIASNQTVSFDRIGIDINQFMDNHLKLYNEDYSDMIYEYEITDVVYSNDNVGSETATQSDKVKITVTNKYNLPVNYDANRYSPRVEFDFSVSNKTSKSIKGIQGVLTIKDLFGEKIISLNCDFTGQTIAGNSKVTYEGIGFDINQFKDDHVKVYNEDFEDLIFEYEVTKIVYSDGTQE